MAEDALSVVGGAPSLGAVDFIKITRRNCRNYICVPCYLRTRVSTYPRGTFLVGEMNTFPFYADGTCGYNNVHLCILVDAAFLDVDVSM